MKKPIEERIAAAKIREQRAATRVRNLEAKAKNESRTRDTRRKIVVGSAILMAIEKDAELAERIRIILAGFVGRPHDREVVSDLLDAG